MHTLEIIPCNMNIASAAVIMDLKNVGELLVDKDDQILGILTESDIIRKVVARCKDPSTTKTSDVMTAPLATIDEEKTIEEATSIMLHNNVKQLVVTQNNIPVGLITTRIISNNMKIVMKKFEQQTLAKTV